jgi:CBS domain-containing protein
VAYECCGNHDKEGRNGETRYERRRKIAGLLLDHKISAVPVIDDEDRVVGIISEGDLLGRPPSGSPRGWWLRLFDESAVCLEEIVTARHLKARDVMTSPVVTVGEQTPIDVLATLMRRCRVKRVPVLRDRKRVGIVSRTDVLDALVQHTAAADERGWAKQAVQTGKAGDDAAGEVTHSATDGDMDGNHFPRPSPGRT